MKQLPRRTRSPLHTMPFLLFAFILVVVVSWILSGVGFDGVFSASVFNSPRGVLLLVVGPLVLLAFPAWLLWSLISHSLHAEGPSPMRFRLFVFQLILIVAVSLPQSLMIGRFVSASLGSWFDQDIAGALASASDISGLYTEERERIVEKVGARFFNGLSIVNYRSRPIDWMNEIRSLDIHSASCQVYMQEVSESGIEYVPIVETGDSSRFIPVSSLQSVRNGFFTLPGEEVDLYRYGQIVRYSNGVYVCVYTSLLPEGFSAKAGAIEAADSRARVIDILSPFFPYFGFWLYLLFCVPSACMAVCLAWLSSCEATAPVRSLRDALAAYEAGDDKIRLVSHTADELTQAAESYNRIAAKRKKT